MRIEGNPSSTIRLHYKSNLLTANTRVEFTETTLLDRMYASAANDFTTRRILIVTPLLTMNVRPDTGVLSPNANSLREGFTGTTTISGMSLLITEPTRGYRCLGPLPHAPSHKRDRLQYTLLVILVHYMLCPKEGYTSSLRINFTLTGISLYLIWVGDQRLTARRSYGDCNLKH